MICGQTVLPDRTFLIDQKLFKNAKIAKNHRYSIGGLIMITDDVIIGVDLCKMHFLSSNDNREVTIVTLISLCP